MGGGPSVEGRGRGRHAVPACASSVPFRKCWSTRVSGPQAYTCMRHRSQRRKRKRERRCFMKIACRALGLARRLSEMGRSARKLPTFRIGSAPQIARRARAREWGLGQQRARLSPIKSCPVLVSPAVANALHVRPGVCFRMQTHVCTAVLGTLLYRVVSYSQSLRQQSL